MTDTYALTVRFESYEYEGAFYLAGEGYGTPSDVLQHVAADHILRIEQSSAIEEYLLDVMAESDNIGQEEYDELESDVECGVHVDVAHQRFAFWAGEQVVELQRHPSKSKLDKIAEDLRS